MVSRWISLNTPQKTVFPRYSIKSERYPPPIRGGGNFWMQSGKSQKNWMKTGNSKKVDYKQGLLAFGGALNLGFPYYSKGQCLHWGWGSLYTTFHCDKKPRTKNPADNTTPWPPPHPGGYFQAVQTSLTHPSLAVAGNPDQNQKCETRIPRKLKFYFFWNTTLENSEGKNAG